MLMCYYGCMGDPERQPAALPQPESEFLDPHHFYAAYVFDRASEREPDIHALIEQAQDLGYPIRHWWLSDAMHLQGSPDRLIVCIHHPSRSEDAGIDLYDALKEKGIHWDDLGAAAVEEYGSLGRPVEDLEDIRSATGDTLFPHPTAENKNTFQEEPLFTITVADVRSAAENYLDRALTDGELWVVLERFKNNLAYLNWRPYLDEAIQHCQKTGEVGPCYDHWLEAN